MALTERLVAAAYPGKVIAGRYRLEELLGTGAVGEVWLAEHVHMRKRYALKLLDAKLASSEIVARFEREAVAAANVVHPGIAAGTDFGRDEDGCFFLVLEYVKGRSLRKLIEEGNVSPPRALAIARQVLQAVSAAHAKGVVHRDLKPENVMLAEKAGQDGDVIKVLDFGIAKVDPATVGGSALTRAGTIYGTPAYMAPEQGLGEDVDHRADLYAVGVLIFELVAGLPPFPGEGVEVIARQVYEQVPALSSQAKDVTPELDALVAALTKKSRDERPADVAAALVLLESAWQSYANPRVETVDGVASANAADGRRRALDPRRLAAIAGVALVLIAVPVALLVGRSAPEDDADDARPRKKSHAAATAASAASEAASASASVSASTSAAPTPAPSISASASASIKAAATAAKPVSATKKPVKKKDEKGWDKIKSIFK